MNIPEFSPSLGEQELAEVIAVLKSGWITEGERTTRLEAQLADYFGCKRVLMMPNGTLAIFAALKLIGIGPGDEVIVPDFTFFGTASAVILTGATPVFCDVDPETGNIDAASAEASLGPKVRAILPVHLYGQSADMDPILNLAERHRLRIVEDAAQGMGVTYRGRHVGTMGDVGCLSFFADKTLTTGEGGALLLNDDRLIEQGIYFKNQGRLHRGCFVHPCLGYNFRITDLQAAIGLAQFDRLPALIESKQRISAHYRKRLESLPGIGFLADRGFGALVPFRMAIRVNRPNELAEYLEGRGIGSRRFFYPLHLQPSLNAENSMHRVPLTHSIRLFESGLMLPTGPQMTANQIDAVCDAIHSYWAAQAIGPTAGSSENQPEPSSLTRYTTAVTAVVADEGKRSRRKAAPSRGRVLKSRSMEKSRVEMRDSTIKGEESAAAVDESETPVCRENTNEGAHEKASSCASVEKKPTASLEVPAF